MVKVQFSLDALGKMVFPCCTRFFFHWGVNKWNCLPSKGQKSALLDPLVEKNNCIQFRTSFFRIFLASSVADRKSSLFVFKGHLFGFFKLRSAENGTKKHAAMKNMNRIVPFTVVRSIFCKIENNYCFSLFYKHSTLLNESFYVTRGSISPGTDT